MTDNQQHSGTTASSADKQESIREIVYLIRRLMQAGYLYTKELNKKYQVSAPQLNCLLALYEKGPMPPSQIARLIMVKSSTVTGVIDRLEHKNLVRRTRNSPDRRVINIELTEAGAALAEHAPPPIQQKIVDGLKRLPDIQIKQITHDLQLLTHMLDAHDLDISLHPEDSPAHL